MKGNCELQYTNHSVIIFRFTVGSACRMKVLKYLKKDFKTINEAEEAYGIDYFEKMSNYGEAVTSPEPTVSPGDIIDLVIQNLGRMSQQQRVQLTMHIYSYIAVNDYHEDLKHFIPKDFIELSLLAMQHLKNNGKDNVLYDLSKCLGITREHENISRMDINRMPFGLIAYNCKFFAVDNGSNLRVPQDYMQWMESMCSYFANSWASLHLGPMWSYNDGTEDNCQPNDDACNIIEEALAGILDELTIPDAPVTPESAPEMSPTVSSTHIMNNPTTIWSGISQREKEELKESEAQRRLVKCSMLHPSKRKVHQLKGELWM